MSEPTEAVPADEKLSEGPQDLELSKEATKTAILRFGRLQRQDAAANCFVFHVVGPTGCGKTVLTMALLEHAGESKRFNLTFSNKDFFMQSKLRANGNLTKRTELGREEMFSFFEECDNGLSASFAIIARRGEDVVADPKGVPHFEREMITSFLSSTNSALSQTLKEKRFRYASAFFVMVMNPLRDLCEGKYGIDRLQNLLPIYVRMEPKERDHVEVVNEILTFAKMEFINNMLGWKWQDDDTNAVKAFVNRKAGGGQQIEVSEEFVAELSRFLWERLTRVNREVYTSFLKSFRENDNVLFAVSHVDEVYELSRIYWPNAEKNPWDDVKAQNEWTKKLTTNVLEFLGLKDTPSARDRVIVGPFDRLVQKSRGEIEHLPAEKYASIVSHVVAPAARRCLEKITRYACRSTDMKPLKGNGGAVGARLIAWCYWSPIIAALWTLIILLAVVVETSGGSAFASDKILSAIGGPLFLLLAGFFLWIAPVLSVPFSFKRRPMSFRDQWRLVRNSAPKPTNPDRPNGQYDFPKDELLVSGLWIKTPIHYQTWLTSIFDCVWVVDDSASSGQRYLLGNARHYREVRGLPLVEGSERRRTYEILDTLFVVFGVAILGLGIFYSLNSLGLIDTGLPQSTLLYSPVEHTNRIYITEQVVSPLRLAADEYDGTQ